jgi:enoyl-CoA hydratase
LILERRREGPIEVLTLNRPEAGNALSPELLADLGAALADIESDPAIHVVIVTGAGDRIFCAGMDLRAFGASGSGAPPTPDPRASAMREAMFSGEYPKPVVAAVNGAAVGGGLELVLGSDLVVAAEHARFGLPEVKRGLFPAGGGTMIATRIPLALALEMGLTGELVDARRAADIGLVNRVVPADGLMAGALELAGRVAANGPLGVQLTKRLMRSSVQRGPEHGRATTAESAAVFGSEDAKEGAAAFIEKRDPHFTGR